MGLFKKNPNEVLYPNGKKPFMSVIKNECAPGTLIWKVPYEDFNENSKLIVAEHEEAMFYKNGVIEEIFTAGEFTLSTNNYPFLSRLKNMLTDGVSIYNCKIYYVNKSHELDLRWGTDGPVQVKDKIHNMATTLISRGAYTIQVKDAKKFYLKYVGPNTDQVCPADIMSSFRSPFNQKVKTTLGKVIASMDDEILGICARQEEIAESMKPAIEEVLDEYGIRVVNFYMDALEIADDASRKVLEAARSEKASLNALGISWEQKQSADIMNNLAKNEGNAFAGAGAGIGMGLAVGGAFGNMAGSMMSSFEQPSQSTAKEKVQAVCPNCKAPMNEGAKFCSGCGSAVSKFCTGCGKSIGAGAAFCIECGTKQE